MLDLRIGSLFSGIGGLELGLEQSGLGRTVWQVEKEEFCRGVLARHWPEAKRFEDVCAVGKQNLEPVDVLCGGFPCQDVSSAGARKGLAGSRSGLWYEYSRIVRELEPAWVVVENVASGAKLWVDAVVRELGQSGYACVPVPVQADALGAPYPRARVFVVARRLADTDRGREPVRGQHAEVASTSEASRVVENPQKPPNVADSEQRQLQETTRRGSYPWQEPMPAVDGVVPGAPARVAAQRAAGNCVVPICAEVVGWYIRELLGQ